MDYPLEILPNPLYKVIDCDLSAHFLIRLIDANDINEIIDSDTFEIKLKYIYSPEERIDDLSFSLLGIYGFRHINLQFTEVGKDKFMHYCRPDELVGIPVYEAEFTNDANRHFWCISIHRLNNEHFAYTRGKDPFTAICLVEHSPMKWNYWHFSLRWQTDLGRLEELEEKLRRKVAKRIGHSARVILSHFARVERPEHPILPAKCYCKN
jgi:hypothetical protein